MEFWTPTILWIMIIYAIVDLFRKVARELEPPDMDSD